MRRALFALVIVMIATAASAATPAAPPQALAVAENATWTTTLDVRAPEDAAVTFALTNIPIGPVASVSLAPGGEATIREWGIYLGGIAEHAGFGTFALPDPSVDVRSRLFYHSGKDSAAFVVPKLVRFAQHAGETGQARGVTSDDREGTQVVIFSKPSAYTLYVYDGGGVLAGVEHIDTTEFVGGAVASHRLTTQVSAGRVKVYEGYAGIGPNPDVDAYGFIAVGPANGTSQAVEPITILP